MNIIIKSKMSNLNEPLFDKVLRVRNTIMEMLEDRGVPRELLPLELNINYIKYMIDEFLNGKPALDMLVRTDDKNYYVKFIQFLDKKTSPTDFGGFLDIIRVIKEGNRFNSNDDIILVIFDEDYNIERNKEKAKETEALLDSNVTIFFYKSVMFNISKHPFVPNHRKLTKEERRKFLKTFMITKDSIGSKLPWIPRLDPVCKYYGFKRGDILCITRASTYAKEHKGYRVVV